MIICLGTQLVQANENTSTASNEVEIKTVQSTITGTVLDDTGQPLPGANVVEKGTTNGTQTDFDGNYSLNVSDGATLVFSYIGFKSTQIAVNGQSTVNATLAEDAAALDEVVVTGYSTQTRGDLTGAVASVDISEAVKAPITNAAEALQGRVSGVTVTSAGSPGGSPIIRIRGFGTSNSNGPLFIIDGVQTDDASILNNINPTDIKQMNVLKDGAASIYGARASNGVVIITTKNGGYNMNSASVKLDMYTGFSQATNLPDVLNAEQHGNMIFTSLANSGAAVTHPQYGSGATPVVPSTLALTPTPVTTRAAGTDWIQDIFRTAITQNFSLSAENGSENGKYAASMSYLNRQGTQLETFFKRASIRLNSEFKVGEKITIGQHLNGSFSNTRAGNQRDIGGSSPLLLAYRNSPLLPVFADDGSFAGTYSNATGLANSPNPVAELTRGSDDFSKNFRVLGDIYATWEIFDGLTAKTSLGGDIQAFDSRAFLALNPEHSEARSVNTLTEENFNTYNYIWTNTLNYNKQFGDHSINALVGIEAVETRTKGNSVSLNEYLFESPEFYLLTNGLGTPVFNSAYDDSNSLYSVFGSLNYSFKSKYYLSGTLRRDTSSRFIGDNKSDVFPSLSGAWAISEEDFFNKDGFLSRLKLKGSWGKLGNQTIPGTNPTQNISSLSLSQANYAFDGSGAATPGAVLTSVGNEDLRWETSTTINAGVEMGFFENALSFSFEYFKLTTNDLISQDNSQISTTAFDASAPYVNLGSVENTGFDIALGYQKQTESGFSFGIDANLSAYDNEVTELVSAFQLGNAGFRGGAVTRTAVGQPISSFFGREVTGFDDSGRFTYRDVNEDGVINDDDRTFIGSPHPDFTYGLNFNFGYKNFDLSAFIQGSHGNDIYNYTKVFTDFPTFVDGNRSTRVLDSWTPTNTNATLPALGNAIVNNEADPNSYFVEDGSYARLKNLQIGYTLPETIMDKIGMSSIRFYVQASNLFTITGYNGLDPEVQPVFNNDGTVDNLTLAVDYGSYPVARIFTLGTNLKF
ncbi:MAG: TonB-dependent receptor [Maribacter sp.]|nr:TonB-dependent receptor [Maribacter sp.]